MDDDKEVRWREKEVRWREEAVTKQAMPKLACNFRR